MTSPRWSRWLLARLAPRWRRDEVIGDLEEMHVRYRRQHGAAAAWGRSSFDALIVALGFVGDRWTAVVGWATWPDLGLGWRQMRHTPLLSATSVLALATGIGLATVGFSLLDGMLYSTLPYPNGDRFVRIMVGNNGGGGAPLELALFDDIAARVPALGHVGAMTGGEFTLALPNGDLETIPAVVITPASLRHVPGAPLIGRPLLDADSAPSAAPVALMAERLWRRRFGADPETVGRSIDLAGVQRTVVGVMPDRFEFPTSPDAWVPFERQWLGATGAVPVTGTRLFGILEDGASIEMANAQLQAIASDRQATGLDAAAAVRLYAQPYALDGGNLSVVAFSLVAVLVLVLLVVASNIATLMTARGWARSLELAVRTALGADRTRIVGQLFVEVLVLGAIASVLGAACATAFLGWINRHSVEIPFWIDFTPNPRTILFVVLVGFAATLVAGIAPALAVTRGNVAAALHAGGRTVARGFGRTAKVLIIVEVAMSVALLIGATALARGVVGHISAAPVPDEAHVLTARITAGPLSAMPGRSASESPLHDTVIDAIEKIPGVLAAGAVTQVPRRDPPAELTVIEVSPAAATLSVSLPAVGAGPGFFDALHATATRGRLLTADDGRSGAAPVAVVNESFVADIVGGRNPIGMRLRAARSDKWREIVGVVPDLGLSTADRSRAAGFYTPLQPARSFRVAIRTASDPLRLVPSLRKALVDLDPALQVRDVMPLPDVGKVERTFLSGMASAMVALGGVALALSVVSVYALLSFAVTQRTREIGIRIALGASRPSVVAGVMRAAAVCLVSGLLLGLALGALLLEARGLIAFRIPTGGLWVVPAVLLPLAIAGVAACWLPTRRALGIQPAEALRD